MLQKDKKRLTFSEMISAYQKSKIASLLILFHWMGKYGLSLGYGIDRETKFQDLTHPFKNDFTRTWPINKPFKFTIGTRGLTTLGDVENVYLENNEFFMASTIFYCIACISLIQSTKK